ncbi:Hint domain-containing protein [Shimia biformata]|uniref:Hint domain-containing protein n=1 Tax=Shimia biformata TaxID=1294299 RepID=UPI00194F472E|nr:Hint domain-containing protein [Shimia biformata]
MQDAPHQPSLPTQSLPVYHAEDFRVVNGANLGDGLSFAAELVPDDVYELAHSARVERLVASVGEGGALSVAPKSRIGTPGAVLHADCVVTLMPPNGTTIEILVLVEVDGDGHVAQIFAVPLAPLSAKTPYSLVGVSTKDARRKLAMLACVSFTRGTRITSATGEQIPVEELQVGDRVLTRDDGPQEIRWIGHNTVRAYGEFAPIVITKDTLNNAHDLIVSPDHRLFIYQRHDKIGAGRAELLVKARHLVNGDTVHVQEGGFVEYYQLLFDRHQIIFAEGISAETMMVDTRTRPVLPGDLEDQVAPSERSGLSSSARALDVHEDLLKHPDIAALLRRASSR